MEEPRHAESPGRWEEEATESGCSSPGETVYREVTNLLTGCAVNFTVHEHEPVVSIEEAERKAPSLVDGLLKTVVFRVKDSFWVLAAVRCHDRIDYRRLAAALGVNRRQIRSLSPAEVERDLGFAVGGVGPIPLRNNVRAVFDQHLSGAGRVRCGSGRNTHTLELDFQDLLRVTGGIVSPIVRE
ncbi:MAG: YbaK/EbsC family protein [Deltaproteobacteria bacterium]|nr:YbaK/EbsC family protein [Deltaproteobacteria bacterium]